MQLREYTTYCESEILRLYASVGWTAYTDDPAALREGFAHSLLTIAAYEDEALAGLVRVVGDGATDVRCCKRCWTDTARCVSSNWSRTTQRKRSHFTNPWALRKMLHSAAAA